MCCSVHVSKMSNTLIYSGEAQKNEKSVHVLAYQNSAETDGPNAMVLPFPTDVKMGKDNIIDTSKFKSFLKNITNASKHRSFTKGARRLTLGSAAFHDSLAEVFDVGSYTVVLADKVSQIPEALTRVPKEKRPEISTQFLLGFGHLYPQDPIAICCWNGSIEAEPLLCWYEPRNYSTLFVPTMDAHDGNAPQVGTLVRTDHIISVGSVGPTNGNEVHYQDKIPNEVKEILPTHVFGGKLHHWNSNADTFVKTAQLHTDKWNPDWVRSHGEKQYESASLNGWQ